MTQDEMFEFDMVYDRLGKELNRNAKLAQQTGNDDILAMIHDYCTTNMHWLADAMEVALEDPDEDYENLGRYADLVMMWWYHKDLATYCVEKGVV